MREKASKRFWLYIKLMFGFFGLACAQIAMGHTMFAVSMVFFMIGCGAAAYMQGKREGSIL